MLLSRLGSGEGSEDGRGEQQVPKKFLICKILTKI